MDALRPLSLDQFAAMTAEMEAGFPRDRVLEAASVSQEQWDLTQETWLLRMAKQGQQRKLALLDRYNELLAKHRKSAQRKMRAEKRKLKGPMPVAPETHLSPILRSPIDDGGATFQKPSFADSPAPFVAPAQPVAAPSWMATGSVVVPVVPSVVTAPPPVVAAAPMLEDDDDEVGVTAVGAAIPVDAIAAAGPSWLQAGGAPAKEERSIEVTAPGEQSPLAGAAPAWLRAKRPDGAAPPPPPSNQGVPLPGGPAWLQSSASFPAVSPAPPAQVASEAKAPPNAPPARPNKRGATLSTEVSPWAAGIGGDAAAKGDALPFQKGAAPAPAQPAPAATGGLPFQRAQAAPQASPGATTAGAPAALPFQKAPSASPSQPGIAASPAPAQPAPAAAGGLPFQRAQTAPQAAPSATSTGVGLPFQRPQAPAQSPSATGSHQALSASTGSHPAVAMGATGSHQALSASATGSHAAVAMGATGSHQALSPSATGSHAARPASATGSHPAQTAPSKGAAPRLSVEQLAWLQAQVETSAELGRAAREQLGLDEAEYAAERAFWQARFQQDRATVERYSQLFYHYRRGR